MAIHNHDLTERTKQDSNDCRWGELVHLTDPLHGVGEADFAAGPRQHHEAEDQSCAHLISISSPIDPKWMGVVRGGVRLTRKTPKTIRTIPSLRAIGTYSPSQRYPSSGTKRVSDRRK